MPTIWKTFGHDGVKRILDRHLAGSNFSQAYLFSGPSGIGKQVLAREFAAKILRTSRLDSHPDFIVLDQTGEISVEQARDFTSRLVLKPLIGDKKVAVINNAEQLNTQSANSLLKTLEEPSGDTIIILVGDAQRLLPTIRSRCLILSMQLFSARQLREFAADLSLEEDPSLFDLCFGSPAALIAMNNNPELARTRSRELERWQVLKAAAVSDRLLGIGDLAELEGEELTELLQVWLFSERQNLNNRPQGFMAMSALGAALRSLRSNQNKKSVLQSLMFSL